MLKDTQHLIIITLGIIALASIITQTETGIVIGTVLGILGGFLTGKKIYTYNPETITVEGEEDVQ